MMRADEDRVEMQGEREDHHRVERARRIGHHDIRQLQIDGPGGKPPRTPRRSQSRRRTSRSPRPDSFSSSRTSVLAKRDPVSAPSPTITALTIHHGIAAWIRPLPCSTAEASMAPKIRPPGNRSLCENRRATRCETTTSTTISRNRIGDGEAARHRRRRNQPEQRQRHRQASGENHHADGLHDRNAAQVGVMLGRMGNHLRQRAGRGAEQRRQHVPAMHLAQIEGAAEGRRRSCRRTAARR